MGMRWLMRVLSGALHVSHTEVGCLMVTWWLLVALESVACQQVCLLAGHHGRCLPLLLLLAAVAMWSLCALRISLSSYKGNVHVCGLMLDLPDDSTLCRGLG